MYLSIKKGSIGQRAVILFGIYVISLLVLLLLSSVVNVPIHSLGIALLFFLFSTVVLCFYGKYESVFFNSYKKKIAEILTLFLSAFFSSLAIVHLYQTYAFDRHLLTGLFTADGLLRAFLLFWLFLTVHCCMIYGLAKVQDWIFKNRWLVAGIAFAVLVICQIHFSNISCFTYYIQPNSETAFTDPLFGIPRGIRSDEWLVNTPFRISSEYSGYGEYNYIVRATENHNVSVSALYGSYSALSNVMNLGFYLFGSEYGISFYWSAAFILSFMISFELSYILSKRNRLVALLGAVLLALSSFNLWWSISPLVLISSQGAIVCAYYFFEVDKRYQRILLALGVALAGANFICNLYPAWQVPIAYIVLAFLAWILVSHIEKIKSLRVWDWLIVVAAACFMISIVVSYLYDNRAYMEAVMSTVYPGARFEVGGYALDKLKAYMIGPLFPYKDVGNNSEAGTFFNLFPLPMILSVVLIGKQVYRWIRYKEKKVDLCVLILMIPTAFLTVYCTVGFPEWLAKYSLMSYSTSFRAVDFVGLLNVYFLMRLMADGQEEIRFSKWIGAVVVIALLLESFITCNVQYSGYMPVAYVVFITVVILTMGAVCCCRMNARIRNRIIAILALIFMIPGLSVLPITKGLDSVLEKPASHAVQNLVANDPNAKWITHGDIVTSQFLIANGAPTVNSVNYIPNMELWSKLDPAGKYNEVYNRYSHVICTFTDEETSFDLVQADLMNLHLSYNDFSTVGIQYVFSLSPVSEESDVIDLNLIYQEENVYIYQVSYLQGQ